MYLLAPVLYSVIWLALTVHLAESSVSEVDISINFKLKVLGKFNAHYGALSHCIKYNLNVIHVKVFFFKQISKCYVTHNIPV